MAIRAVNSLLFLAAGLADEGFFPAVDQLVLVLKSHCRYQHSVFFYLFNSL